MLHAELQVRRAGRQDAELLWQWRNDPATRQASRQTEEVAWDKHLAWLERVLNDPQRRLYVAQEDGIAVGTVRADWVDESWRLSWTTAPSARGRGVARRMVQQVAAEIPQALSAEVRPDNLASIKVAEAIGMVPQGTVAGFVQFRREPRSGDECSKHSDRNPL